MSVQTGNPDTLVSYDIFSTDNIEPDKSYTVKMKHSKLVFLTLVHYILMKEAQ
jgi:hypothetical protein